MILRQMVEKIAIVASPSSQLVAKVIKEFLHLHKMVFAQGEWAWLKTNSHTFLLAILDENDELKIYETFLPKKKADGTKAERTDRQILWKKYHNINWLIKEVERKGEGLFYLPGKPIDFPLKGYSKGSNDIGVELDWGTQEEQQAQYDWLEEISGLNLVLLSSGGKSLHGHIIADENLDISLRTNISRLLSIVILGDPAVTQEQQPMRACGFIRGNKGKYQELISPGRIHSFKEIAEGLLKAFYALGYQWTNSLSEERWRLLAKVLKDNASPAAKKREQIKEILAKTEEELFPKFEPKIRQSNNSGFSSSVIPPLEIFLSKTNQDYLKGVGSNRNTIGTALLRDALGCEAQLKIKGIPYSGDAYSIFIEYCNNCAPGNGWNQREWDGIWRSNSNKSFNPSISDEHIENRLHWYRYNNDPEYQAKAKAEYRKQYQKENSNSYINDIEIDEQEYDAYVKRLEEEELILEAIEQDRLAKKGITFIENLKGQLLKLSPKWFKGFGITKKDLENIPTPPLPTKIKYTRGMLFPTPEEYADVQAPEFYTTNKDDAFYFFIAAKQAGWKNIVDNRPTGEGKSYTAGLSAPAPDSTNKNWYFDINHRNPSTPAIKENYTDLRVRHNGLTKDKDGNLKRAVEGDSIDVQSNCHYTDVFTNLSQKNIDYQQPVDNAPNPICSRCPFYEKCVNSQGDGYGFLSQRKTDLSARQIRLDIRSAPSPDSYKYGNDTFYFEEGIRALDTTKEINVAQSDLNKLKAQLFDLPSDFPYLEEIKTFLAKLTPLFVEGIDEGKFGLNTESVKQQLYTLEHIDEIIQALTSILNNQIRDLISNSFKSTNYDGTVVTEVDNAKILSNIELLPKNWLIPFLKILKGDRGAFTLSHKNLIITIPNKKTVEIIKAAKHRIWLDATANLDELATIIEEERKQFLILTTENRQLNNLIIKPIQVDGLGSSNRSDTAQARAKAIHAVLKERHPNSNIIGYKKDTQELNLDGHWGKHNRGTNKFEGKEVIILDGLPCPNMHAVQAKYLCFHDSLEGFEDYYNHLIEVELIQGVGRPRANLYPDTNFIVYLVASFKHFNPNVLAATGCVVDPIKEGIEITPEAGDKVQLKQHILLETVLEAIKGGYKVAKLTQTELAKLTGIPQQTISRLLTKLTGGIKRLRNLLISLYESLNREMGKITAKELIQKSLELQEWLEYPPILETEGFLKLAEELEKVEESAKLALIETYILNHPQPLIPLGHLLGLITQDDTGQVVVT